MFHFFTMSADRLVSLRESLVSGNMEYRALSRAIKAEVRRQRRKSLPLHIAHVVWVIYAFAAAPNIIIAAYLKYANVRGGSDEELLGLAEESFSRTDLQPILDICDEHALRNRFL